MEFYFFDLNLFIEKIKIMSARCRLACSSFHRLLECAAPVLRVVSSIINHITREYTDGINEEHLNQQPPLWLCFANCIF
jgi:hypothetical protein